MKQLYHAASILAPKTSQNKHKQFFPQEYIVWYCTCLRPVMFTMYITKLCIIISDQPEISGAISMPRVFWMMNSPCKKMFQTCRLANPLPWEVDCQPNTPGVGRLSLSAKAEWQATSRPSKEWAIEGAQLTMDVFKSNFWPLRQTHLPIMYSRDRFTFELRGTHSSISMCKEFRTCKYEGIPQHAITKHHGGIAHFEWGPLNPSTSIAKFWEVWATAISNRTITDPRNRSQPLHIPAHPVQDGAAFVAQEQHWPVLRSFRASRNKEQDSLSDDDDCEYYWDL